MFGEVLAAAMPFLSQLQSSRAGQLSTSWMLNSCPCGLCRCMQAKHANPGGGTDGGSKMFKREEIEAEQTDDESVDRHSAGLLREYQV